MPSLSVRAALSSVVKENSPTFSPKPQRLSFPLHSENDEIVLSYRVSKVMERARIELIVDGNVLYTEQKLKISPSRRNKIRLTSEMLRKIERAEILELNATED